MCLPCRAHALAQFAATKLQNLSSWPIPRFVEGLFLHNCDTYCNFTRISHTRICVCLPCTRLCTIHSKQAVNLVQPENTKMLKRFVYLMQK